LFPGEVQQLSRAAVGLQEWHPTSTTADLGSGVGASLEGGQHWKPRRKNDNVLPKTYIFATIIVRQLDSGPFVAGQERVKVHLSYKPSWGR